MQAELLNNQRWRATICPCHLNERAHLEQRQQLAVSQ